MKEKKINSLSFVELSKIVKQKIASKEKGSYSYEIAKQGVEKTSRKVGEEALEVVIAAFLNDKKSSNKTHQELVGELCDLFYHSFILMAEQGVEIEEIMQEFAKRNSKKK
jgi:phosphoribosyl-ATP pyrophosphohydrolase